MADISEVPQDIRQSFRNHGGGAAPRFLDAYRLGFHCPADENPWPVLLFRAAARAGNMISYFCQLERGGVFMIIYLCR